MFVRMLKCLGNITFVVSWSVKDFFFFIKYLPGWMFVDRAEEEVTRSVTTKLINYNSL